MTCKVVTTHLGCFCIEHGHQVIIGNRCTEGKLAELHGAEAARQLMSMISPKPKPEPEPTYLPEPEKTNVVDAGIVTKLKGDANRVLYDAILAELSDVIIIGYDKDGDEYFHTNLADGGDALWHLERAKHKLIS